MLSSSHPLSSLNSSPTFIHEYKLTHYSLYAAVSVGINAQHIIEVLNKFSKLPLPVALLDFIKTGTDSVGKIALVLKLNRYFIESENPTLLGTLLEDEVIRKSIVEDLANRQEKGNFFVHEPEEMNRLPSNYSFEVQEASIEDVKRRCVDLGLPILEEYDFRKDRSNVDLAIDLKHAVQIRPYQEESLSKLLGNGRVRSGIIVLPCGAGKTLVGVVAACTIKKSCLVLCPSSVSVSQWKQQFKQWSSVRDRQISILTAVEKETVGVSNGSLSKSKDLHSLRHADLSFLSF